jgi:hypothetical protein
VFELVILYSILADCVHKANEMILPMRCLKTILAGCHGLAGRGPTEWERCRRRSTVVASHDARVHSWSKCAALFPRFPPASLDATRRSRVSYPSLLSQADQHSRSYVPQSPGLPTLSTSHTRASRRPSILGLVNCECFSA